MNFYFKIQMEQMDRKNQGNILTTWATLLVLDKNI